MSERDDITRRIVAEVEKLSETLIERNAEISRLLADRDRLADENHVLEVKLTGYDEFKAARTEAEPDKDDIWEFYDRKLWASILRWKGLAETYRVALEQSQYLCHAPEYELSDAFDEIDAVTAAALSDSKETE